MSNFNYPKSLYKYRKFDKHTIETLKTGSIYLCPADKLDDQFECSTSISSDLRTGNIDKLTNMLKDYIFELLPQFKGFCDRIDFFKVCENNKVNITYLKDIITSNREGMNDKDLDVILSLLNYDNNYNNFELSIKNGLNSFDNLKHNVVYVR